MTHSANHNKNIIEHSICHQRVINIALHVCVTAHFSYAAGKLTVKSHKLALLTKAHRTSVLYKGTHWYCLV